jgi:ribosomal protein S27E
VVVYDTIGLEHGSCQEFLRDTKTFLDTLQSSPDIRNHIHAVWYVVDLAHARFQAFEAMLCRTVLQDVPIFFVLNKADTATLDQSRTIEEEILRHCIPNCKGIFRVVADRKNFSVDSCPNCKSEDFRFKQRTKEIVCFNCKETSFLKSTSGLEPLVAATIQQLPEIARHAFVTAQQVSERERLRQAKQVILSVPAKYLSTSGKMGRRLVQMATRLAQLWGFEFFPSVVMQETAHFFVEYNSNSWIAKLATFLSDILSAKRLSVALIIATGVEICRALSAIRSHCLEEAVSQVEGGAPTTQADLTTFSLSVSDEFLLEISSGIAHQKLDAVVASLLAKHAGGIYFS